MVMSVTPIVCMTLAFWLGRIGFTCSGGCWAATKVTLPNANSIPSVNIKARLEIIVALLGSEFGAHYVTRANVTARDPAVLRGEFHKFLQTPERMTAILEDVVVRIEKTCAPPSHRN
jgi:hypothetical protein